MAVRGCAERKQQTHSPHTESTIIIFIINIVLWFCFWLEFLYSAALPAHYRGHTLRLRVGVGELSFSIRFGVFVFILLTHTRYMRLRVCDDGEMDGTKSPRVMPFHFGCVIFVVCCCFCWILLQIWSTIKLLLRRLRRQCRAQTFRAMATNGRQRWWWRIDWKWCELYTNTNTHAFCTRAHTMRQHTYNNSLHINSIKR